MPAEMSGDLQKSLKEEERTGERAARSISSFPVPTCGVTQPATNIRKSPAEFAGNVRTEAPKRANMEIPQEILATSQYSHTPKSPEPFLLRKGSQKPDAGRSASPQLDGASTENAGPIRNLTEAENEGRAGDPETSRSSRSSSGSAKYTSALESIISLDISSRTARSSSVDAEAASKPNLKWGSFLDEVLAESREYGRRLGAATDNPVRQLTPQPPPWDSLLSNETAFDAGEILRKYSDLNVFTFRRRSAAVPELEDDLERGEYILSTKIVDPSQCRVYGPGLQERVAGVLSELFIRAVSLDGRFVPHGGSHFVVYVQPVENPHRGEEGSLIPELDPPRQTAEVGTYGAQQSKSLAQVLDNEDGTYTVFFSCSVAVRHQISILLDNKFPVAASPYVVSVVPGRIDASQTVAYGNSLKYFERNGEINDFVIQARDAYGNNIKRGGDKLCVEGLGAINVIETLDFNDGLYRVKFFVREGCENQYCQLSVRYDGQHIQGSPFYPKPVPEHNPRPPPKAAPKAYDDMYLMNPSKSLLGAMNTFSSRMQHTPAPKLPTFPPFPCKTETEDILRKLLNCFEPAKIDLSTHQLAEVRRHLRQCLHGLAEKEGDLENMLRCIKRHVAAGLLHAKIEEGSKDEFNRLISNVAQIQQRLHTTYKSLQHRVADSLPVAFELEDPKEIQRIHKERRAKLLQAHSQLEAKERELRSREKNIKEQISCYMSKLATDLKAREHALEMEQRALKTNTNQVLKLTSNRLKKHARREALIACEREPVEAKKSEFWQRDFQRMLLETPVIAATPKPSAPKAQRYDTKVASLEETRPAETRPVDPNSFAFWIADKQYTVPKEPFIGRPEGVAVDDRTAHRKTNLRRGNPSMVTFTEAFGT